MASSTQEGGPLKYEDIPVSSLPIDFIEPSEVYESIERVKAAGQHAHRDFLLIDVRKTDWVGGTVATSVNFPAQSFYQTRSGVYHLCKQAGIKKVIFYCGKCLLTSILIVTLWTDRGLAVCRELWHSRAELRSLVPRVPQFDWRD